MGQKVHPTGFRLGINKPWISNWYARRNFSEMLHEDLSVRKFVKNQLVHAGISRIEIERAAKRIKVNIHTARPGIIIGKKGAEVDKLKGEIQKKTNKQVFINIKEIRRAETEAQLVAENIALQIVRRIAFRRAMKKAVSAAIRFGAKGVRISCAGRLAGAEMARTEWYREGRVPLQTIRADIDYGFAEAFTTYGVIGVKVWIFKGEILTKQQIEQAAEPEMSL